MLPGRIADCRALPSVGPRYQQLAFPRELHPGIVPGTPAFQDDALSSLRGPLGLLGRVRLTHHPLRLVVDEAVGGLLPQDRKLELLKDLVDPLREVDGTHPAHGPVELGRVPYATTGHATRCEDQDPQEQAGKESSL
jgi:hypothetical protein